MIKCFLLAAGMILCSDRNIDIKCIDEKIELYLMSGVYVEKLVERAVNDCQINARGACSWHGGVDHCSEDEERFICHDGFTSSVKCK